MDFYEALLGKTLSGGGSSTLITKSIALNGTYNASSDNADGYSAVTVDVPNTYTAGDEGKVVDDGALVAQTSASYDKNGTYDTTTVSSITVNVPKDTRVFDSTKPNLYTQEAFNTSWYNKTWNGLTNFNGPSTWTDGDNIYYSNYDYANNEQLNYVLDKSTSTWSTKTWNGIEGLKLYGSCIWTDGDNIYYSNYDQSTGQMNLVLDKSTSTWSTKTWNGIEGLTSFIGNNIWTDGENIYYSYLTDQYVLDKTTSTWSTKTWTGLTNFYGRYIFVTQDRIHYYSGSTFYDFYDGSWISPASQYKPSGNGNGEYIWTDGTHLYNNFYASTGQVATSLSGTPAWGSVTFSGMNQFYGSHVWTDGENIYYSQGSTQKYLGTTKSPNITQPSASCKPQFK